MPCIPFLTCGTHERTQVCSRLVWGNSCAQSVGTPCHGYLIDGFELPALRVRKVVLHFADSTAMWQNSEQGSSTPSHDATLCAIIGVPQLGCARIESPWGPHWRCRRNCRKRKRSIRSREQDCSNDMQSSTPRLK